jgi:hypothetical protein
LPSYFRPFGTLSYQSWKQISDQTRRRQQKKRNKIKIFPPAPPDANETRESSFFYIKLSSIGANFQSITYFRYLTTIVYNLALIRVPTKSQFSLLIFFSTIILIWTVLVGYTCNFYCCYSTLCSFSESTLKYPWKYLNFYE